MCKVLDLEARYHKVEAPAAATHELLHFLLGMGLGWISVQPIPAPARPTPALLSSALLPPLRPAQHRHLWWAQERLSFFNRSFRPHHPRSLQVPALSVEAAQLQLEQPEGLQITALTGAVGTVGSSIVVPAFLALQASAAPHFRSVAAPQLPLHTWPTTTTPQQPTFSPTSPRITSPSPMSQRR